MFSFMRYFAGMSDEEITLCPVYVMNGDFKDADPTKDSAKVLVRHISTIKNVVASREIQCSSVDGMPFIYLLVEIPERSAGTH
jgi:hypothetical protein